MNLFIQKYLILSRLCFLTVIICFFKYSYGQDNDTIVIDTTLSPTDSLAQTEKTDTSSADTAAASKIIKDTVLYEAEIIEYDIRQKIIFMHGNSIVRYHKMTLYADTIHFLFDKDMLVATGHPQLIENPDTVVGDYMVYNLKTGRGKVRYGTAKSTEGSRYDGYQISRSDDRHFYITDGAYTSCAVTDSSHYCFYGKNIKVIPGDKAISRPIVLNISNTPVIALPYFITPLQKGRRSGWLSPKWGGNPTHGGYLDNIGYYFAPNDYTDYSLSGRVYEFTDYVASANATYNLKYLLNGSVSGRYSLSGNHDTLNNLWALDYRHDQNILPDESMKLSGRGNIVSGKSFYKDLSEDVDELLQQQINANMSLTKNFKKINAYANLDWSRNHNFKTNMVDQNLPRFSFNLPSRPLIPKKENTLPGITTDEETKWHNRISYSYNMSGNRKYFYNTETGRDESKFDHSGIGQKFSLSAPQKIFKWFDFTPRFNLQHELFDAYSDTASKHMIYGDSIVYDTTTQLNPLFFAVDTILINGDTSFIYAVDTLLDSFYVYDTTSVNSLKSFRKANTYYWNAGAGLSTKLYGIFPIKIFNFSGIRHTFTPSVSYTLFPKKELDRTFPGVGVSYAPARDRGQVIDFRADNLFQGKVLRSGGTGKGKDEPEEKTFTLFSAGISTAYNFEAKSRKWSNIGLSAGIPNNFVDFSFGSTFTPYNESDELIIPKLLSYSISLRPKIGGIGGSLWGGDFLLFEGIQPKDYMAGYNNPSKPGWNIDISPSYSFTRSRAQFPGEFKTDKQYQLGSSARIKFTNIWSASWSSQYDFTKDQFVNHSVNVHCDLECWELKFDWYPSGFNRGAYYFIIKIKKHPEIKWTERESNLTRY